MIIDEIKLINFGIYKNEHIILLSPKSLNKPIVLIGGQNGLGKTTLLDAFQLVFFGKKANCSNRGNLGYNDYLLKCINRDTDPNDGTSIEIKFRTHVDGEERTYEVRRSWGQNGKGVREYFSVYINDTYDKLISTHWHEHFEEIFPSDISHLFFFDGEKIEQLADFEKSAKLLETAIKSLLGLNVVDQLRADISVLNKRKLKDIGTQEERKAVDEMEGNLSQLIEKRVTLLNEQKVAQDLIDKLSDELKEVNHQYEKEGGILYEQRQELEERFYQATNRLGEVGNDQVDLAAGPAPFLLVKDLLKGMVSQSVREDEADKEQFFVEMIKERDQTIIKRLADMNVKKEVRSVVSNFLADDRVNRAGRADIHKYLGLDQEGQETLKGLLNTGLADIKRRIEESVRLSDKVREKLISLERTMDGIPGEEMIAKLINQRKDLQNRIEQARIRHAAMTFEVERLQREEEQVENQIKRILESNANKDLEAKDDLRVITHAKRVTNTLDRFRERVIEKHLKSIEGLILESFNSLLRKKSLIKSLSINPENFKITLYGAKGNTVFPERLSAGERQLLATAMLWGVSRASSMPLPTIIDTPLGRLDSSHRGKLVKNYFPQASHQVVLLSTDEEIVGKYYSAIKSKISHQYLLSYDEKHEATTVIKGYFD